MSETTVAPAPRRNRRLFYWMLYGLYLLTLVLILWTGFLWFCYRVPPNKFTFQLDPYLIHYKEVLDTPDLMAPPPGDHAFRVLHLGGSVSEQFGGELERRLPELVGRPVKVFNLARSAHTSRDSRNKLEYLQNAPFDLIVVYNGVNDIQMNCVPDEIFRDDYSHCIWYEKFERHKAARQVRPGELIMSQVQQRIGLGVTEPDQLHYGNTTKTGPGFRSNFETMIEIAQRKHTPLVLMTFSLHIPENYNSADYQAGKLDYAPGAFHMAVECWGYPADVRRSIGVHNGIIRELAAANPQCYFIDQDQLLKGGQNFCDVCHLSPRGIEQCVENMIQGLRQSGFPRRPETPE
jgi:GDSL-like Lipase/Acylhydrolase family